MAKCAVSLDYPQVVRKGRGTWVTLTGNALAVDVLDTDKYSKRAPLPQLSGQPRNRHGFPDACANFASDRTTFIAVLSSWSSAGLPATAWQGTSGSTPMSSSRFPNLGT